MKEKLYFIKLFPLLTIFSLILILNACQSSMNSGLTEDQISTNVSNTEQAIATEQYIQTLSSYLETLEHQATWTPQPTYTLYPTPTIVLLSPTSSVISSDSFPRLFSYYRGWINYDEEETIFYFLNASIKGKLYGTIDGIFDIVCEPDPEYPAHMKCVSGNINWKNSYMEFTFYADQAKSQIAHQQTFHTNFGPDPLIPANCEAEYRIYDGKCYYAYTCYDQYGNYLYSMDNIPYGGHFEGYSAPCPP